MSDATDYLADIARAKKEIKTKLLRARYGRAIIKKGRFNNLIINWDFNSTPKSKYPVMLFTPDMDDLNNHYHIALSLPEARKLRDWLDEFIKMKKSKK